MKKHKLEALVKGCEGKNSILVRVTGERYCMLLRPESNEKSKCKYAKKSVIRDIGIGHENYVNIYLCDYKKKDDFDENDWRIS